MAELVLPQIAEIDFDDLPEVDSAFEELLESGGLVRDGVPLDRFKVDAATSERVEFDFDWEDEEFLDAVRGWGMPENTDSISDLEDDFLAKKCIRFAETFLGLKVPPFQRQFIMLALSLNPETRLFARTLCVLSMPRKNGKSYIIAVIVTFLATCVYKDGEEIFIASLDTKQAKITDTMIRKFLKKTKIGSKFTFLRDKITSPSGAIIKIIAADSTRAMGYEPACFVVDEYGQFANSEMLDALEDGQVTARMPLGLVLSTFGHKRPNPLGPLSELIGLCTEGFHYWNGQPYKEDVRLPYAACVWSGLQKDGSYGDAGNVAEWVMVNPAIACGMWGPLKVWTATVKKLQNKTKVWTQIYRLNNPFVGEGQDTFMPWNVLESMPKVRPIRAGARVVLGVDGSRTGDCTVIVATCIDTGVQEVIGFWDFTIARSPERLDLAEFKETIWTACAYFNVESVVCDPYYLEDTMIDLAKNTNTREIQVKVDGGFKTRTVKVPPVPVFTFPTNRPGFIQMSYQVRQLYVSGQLYIMDDELKEHFKNVRLKPDGRFEKDRYSKLKIDGAVAAVLSGYFAFRPPLFEVEKKPTPRMIVG